MKQSFSVDRAKFLAVATALAGLASFQACVTTDESDDESTGEAGQDGGGTKSDGGSQSRAGAPSEAGQGGSNGGGSNAGESTGGAGQSGASDGGASEGGAASGGAGQAGAGGAAMCDDSAGDPTCEGVSAGCLPHCNAAVSNLKPAAAFDAINCLLADTTEFCESGYTCLADASAVACAEDVTDVCAAAVQGCTTEELDKPSCAQLLSAFSASTLPSVVQCVEQDCYSVYSCAEGFFYSNQ